MQLKVLQALPSLLQNYAEELKDELLAGALQLCALLQASNVQTVSGVAAATLQQLVAAVFEKVVDEDRRCSDISDVHEVPGDNGALSLRPAAFDAYRMFRDMVLAVEERPAKFVKLTGLAPEASLELVWSALNANARLFVGHAELDSIIRSNLLPAVTLPLSEKHSFAFTVRCLRVVDLLMSRYFPRFPGEFEVILGLLTHSLDADAAVPWKRAVSMELIRNFLSSGSHVIEAYIAYDFAENGKPIVQDLLSAFVRLSAEKPALIGLGQQSTVPFAAGQPKDSEGEGLAIDAAGGMAGVISSAFGVTEAGITGISSDWSLPRTACLDQLDKAEPPSTPDTYIYALVLECVNSLSDALAKAVLPLSVQRHQDPSKGDSSNRTGSGSQRSATRPSELPRSQSFRKRAVPANPLELNDSAGGAKIRAVAKLIDSCWPAFLATSSTFLNAALEDRYYRNLIKSYQRFTQVAGLLRQATPRDALMTTLSKAAVPPHVLNAAMSESNRPPPTHTADTPRIFSGSKGLLSVDSLVSQASALSMDRERRSSLDAVKPMLSTRNLLCLRALLNLAIALGPIMDTAFRVVVDALRQADMVLSSGSTQQAVRNSGSQRTSDSAALIQAFSTEVAAVESAVSRLIESTAEYPNDAFNGILTAFTRLLDGTPFEPPTPTSPTSGVASPPATPTLKRCNFTGLSGISTFAEMQSHDYKFVIPKLGALCQHNVGRFVAYQPEESGWMVLVEPLINVACDSVKPRDARRAASDVLCRLAAETIVDVMPQPELRAAVQRRALELLLTMVIAVYDEDGELTSADLEVQGRALDAMRAILERCGESLISGWDAVVALLSLTFEKDERGSIEEAHTHSPWHCVTDELVDVQVGRAAFSVIQLICSDFLAAVPIETVPSLLEVLHRFTTQSDDLNMSLTAITTARTVADHLGDTGALTGMDHLAAQIEDSDDLVEDVQRLAPSSRSAQLMLLLLHLRQTIAHTKQEARNASLQTVCGILSSRTELLSAAAWDLVLRNLMLRISADDLALYATGNEDGIEAAGSATRDYAGRQISQSIMKGTADILSQHLRTIEQSRRLPSLWEVFLNRMEQYLDCERCTLSAAAYGALEQVLCQVNEGSTTWTTPIYRSLALWLNRVPEEPEGSKTDNQDAYAAYLDAGAELYRLAKNSVGLPQVRKLMDNVYHVVSTSNGPKYGGDVNALSLVQKKALDLLAGLESSDATLQAQQIAVAARLSVLHHHHSRHEAGLGKNGPTFIAVSSESIDRLAALILSYLGASEDPHLDAVSAALGSLTHIVNQKYAIPAKHRDLPLWQRATTCLLKIGPNLIAAAERASDGDTMQHILTDYVAAISGMVRPTEIAGKVAADVAADEAFDIESLAAANGLVISRIGSPSLPKSLPLRYCRSLFEGSIVHPLTPSEVPAEEFSPLTDIHKLPRPKAKPLPPTPRERLSYVCFEQLTLLSSNTDQVADVETLAQAAAPLLILRLAIPIRTYLADRPLRGRYPQQLSELEELLHCFDQITKLRLHPKALAADRIANGHSGPTAHLRYLYPLLAQAVKVAGDQWCGTQEVLVPLQATLEAIATSF